MKPFIYHNPTKLIYGENQQDIGKILKESGHKRVLLVYGKNSIKENGLFDEITKALKDENIEYEEHGGVSSNPTLSHAREGVIKAKGVTAVLAVGGGSVVDESKAIAAAVLSDCDVWELYAGKSATFALDLFVILTISATGSEMNNGTVLTNEETNEKFSFKSPLVFPKVSIINPKFACTLPNSYLAYSAVDIIAHTIEVYFNAESHPNIQNRFAENIVISTMESTQKILKDENNLDARYDFALCSTWALNGLTKIGLGATVFPNHMIEHSLSAIYNVAHGAGLAVVIPAWLKWFINKDASQIKRFAKVVFGKDDAMDGILSLESWFKEIGAPTSLNELNIPKEDIGKIAQNVLKTSKRWGVDDIYTIQTIEEILNNAFKN